MKSNGRIHLGGYEYYLGKHLAGQAVVVAIQGKTVEELMGELAGVIRLPNRQLALPLFPGDYRQQRYAAGLTGTPL